MKIFETHSTSAKLSIKNKNKNYQRWCGGGGEEGGGLGEGRPPSLKHPLK